MKNPILRQSLFFIFCWRLRRHFVALCATQLITTYFALNTSAQAPQGIPYQAIARNASGVAIANTAVKVRFSIRDSIATGPVKYQETHNPTTSALGLFSVNVGMGTVVSGTFSGINWGKNAKFLQVELNTTGGTTYTDLGTTQMMSVPYALFAGQFNYKISSVGDSLLLGENSFLIIPGISSRFPKSGPEVIDIEGNTYKTIEIGGQVWFAENLRTLKYPNGDLIPTNLFNIQWSSTTLGAATIYSNSIYGNFYNGYAVKDPRGLCPAGWHVPSELEWQKLEFNLGITSEADLNKYNDGRGVFLQIGTKMKDPISFGFSSSIGNSSKFTALPGGFKDGTGVINYIGTIGIWWTQTPSNEFQNGLYSRQLSTYSDGIYRNGNSKNSGFSVRCLKD